MTTQLQIDSARLLLKSIKDAPESIPYSYLFTKEERKSEIKKLIKIAEQVPEPIVLPEQDNREEFVSTDVPIAAQEGGPIENAETDLETRIGPMGVINDNDGAPGPSLGGEGVADDLTMEVPEGSYILNSDAVVLVGISDINKVIRDAYTIAAALGQELPADYDPQNKVPIRISNGEAVIPAPLVGVIGLDRLHRWNEEGLKERAQNKQEEAEAQKAQAAQPVTEAPPVQPMQAQMGGMMGYNQGTTVINPNTMTAKEMERLFRGPEESLGPDKEGRPIPSPNIGITVTEEEPISEDIPPAPLRKPEVDSDFKFDPYNIVYGHDLFRDPNMSPLQEQTLTNILLNQGKHKDRIKAWNIANKGNKRISGAFGAYQFLPATLKGLISNLNLDSASVFFTPETQDMLAKELLREIGIYNYIANPNRASSNLSTTQNKLSKIWTSLPNAQGKSDDEEQNIGIEYQDFRDTLKRVQELGPEEGIELLLETIRNAETKLR